MSPRTLAPPPTDCGVWRRLLPRVHPDASGDADLFVWATALHERVASDQLEDACPAHERRGGTLPLRYHPAVFEAIAERRRQAAGELIVAAAHKRGEGGHS